jgi:hypothetical protein
VPVSRGERLIVVHAGGSVVSFPYALVIQGMGKMVHNNNGNGLKTSKQNENVKGRII